MRWLLRKWVRDIARADVVLDVLVSEHPTIAFDYVQLKKERYD